MKNKNLELLTKILEHDCLKLLKNLELLTISRKIAKFPLELFRSNCLDPRSIRLNYYLIARDCTNDKNDSGQTIDDLIKNASNDLQKLLENKPVIVLIFP